jgi:adenylate cyclase
VPWSRRRWPLRTTVFCGIAIGAVALGIAAYATGPVDQLELDTVDARFAVRGSDPAPKNIVLVLIDAKTFSDLNHRFPFPRPVFAQALDTIRRDHPAAVAYDVQFTEPTSPADNTRAAKERAIIEDNALIEAVAKARPAVVLAATEVDHGRTRVFGGDAVVRSVGARVGNTLYPADGDGVIRRVQDQVDGLRSFAIRTAEVAQRRRISSSEVEHGGAWIDFLGPPGTFPTVSFSTVYNGRTPPGFFKNRIAVIGAAAPTLQDVHPTSVSGSDLMTGAEIHANAIDTALRGFPLRGVPWWVDVLLIVVLGAAAPLTSLRWSTEPALLTGMGAGVVFIVASQVVFDSGRILSVVYPLFTLSLSAVGTLSGHYLLGTVERERVRDTFARFVPEQVVDEVLASAEGDVRLGGVRRDATALFADLRGFSTFSEGLEAEQVIDVVNHYLSEMSEAILDHGGTLVAYMGDGLMAVFGAPLEQPDHADRAIAAAREMVNVRLAHLNAWLLSQGLSHVFRMGVGVNSGNVMSGNVGSQRRLEYAAIGDTVNVASRLQEMTKATPHQVLIADSTRERLHGEVADLFFIDELPVRGRSAPIRAWSLRDVAAARPVDDPQEERAPAEPPRVRAAAAARSRDRRRPRRR